METLDYADNTKAASPLNWDAAITPTTSLDIDRSPFEQTLNHIRVVQQKKIHTDRPTIPATIFEKLAFYRAHVTVPNKTQITCMEEYMFNRYLWYHILNVFCKSLPNTYVYMFLSSYAPDHHFFLSKMAPIAYGCNWAIIISGFLYLISYTDFVALQFDYVISGIIYRNPWNRCPSRIIHSRNFSLSCYNLDEFTSLLQNETVIFKYAVYISSKREFFQMAPTSYFINRVYKNEENYFYFIFLWIVAAIHYKQLFKRHIWKVLNNVQMLLNVVYVLSFSHMVLTSTYFGTNNNNVTVLDDDPSHYLLDADLDVLSESMTAPPIVHVLTSRSTSHIQPDRDSIIMIISNSLYYIFRGWLSFKLKTYCESMVKAPLLFPVIYNSSPFFFLWPIYFSNFYFGDFFTIIFFTLSFMTEFLTIVITLQCLIEIIVCEWKWAKRKIVTVILIAIGIIYNLCSDILTRGILYIYSIGMVTLAEVLVIYCIYPFDRLVDDITFYYGTSPTRLRVLNFSLVPIFYARQMYNMYEGLFKVFEKFNNTNYKNILYFLSVPYLLGAVYAAFVCLFIKKKNIKCVFKPHSEWGPKDIETRRLRKQYDSRNYIGSQAPRNLSRYMIQKSRLESYKLDIKYDNVVRRSSLTSTEIHTEDEKKRK
ncbi:unnamed protein product [Parnassius mnemosyne]|uniref:Uncharacterized protein n=1 Tax=Parnassius mnemosyne TaxID=213953 RepID=A0AAV1M3D8_9NEOP